jgi:adenylate cyclase
MPLVGLLLLLVPVVVSAQTQPPKAKAGVLDLSAWDFESQGIVPLNGEWRLYWGALLEPGMTIHPAAFSPQYFNFPGSWNDLVEDGKKVGAEGFATFALDVILPDSSQLLGLKSRSVNTAWRVWVDDRELGGAGKVGENAESMVPASLPRIFAFQPQGKEVRITVQVSNFYHRKGGFWWPLQLGLHDQIQKDRESGLAIDLFLLGALLIMGFYHLGLYMLRPKDTSTLFFGIFCLLVGSRMLFINENFSAELFPWLSWAIAKKTEYVITFLLTPFFFFFLNKLYPKEFPIWPARILAGFNGLLVLFAILAPAPLFTLTPTIFNLASMGVFAFTLFCMVLTIVRKREYALPIFIGTLILVLSTVNDMLNDSEIIRTGFFAPLGLFIFIFIQSYILSKRFSNAYQLAEVYAKTFQMFVPRQFLDRIAKQGIGSIKLGNAEQDDVTILFSDIRSFTAISETLTPDGVLSFLNGFLSRMEPPIREQGGFVDKYLGDAIMALFDSSHSAKGVSSAIHAALGMQAALQKYNKERKATGLPEIVCGIGLHSGSVIIGTIGGAERMDSTAIGDAVNLASRIEGLTKLYKIEILASDETVGAPGAREQFLIRFVDRVRVVGKSVPVGIWEVVGKRGDAHLSDFEAILPTYEAALQKYFALDFAGAIVDFQACYIQRPQDTVLQMYIDRCAQFIAAPPLAGWSGVTDMGVK